MANSKAKQTNETTFYFALQTNGLALAEAKVETAQAEALSALSSGMRFTPGPRSWQGATYSPS